MCLKIDAWLCFGPGPDHEDDCGRFSAKGGGVYHAGATSKTTTPNYYPQPQTVQRNANYHHGHQQGVVAHHANGGHKAPHLHHHQQQLPVAAAADEEDRKASNDARRGHCTTAARAAATKGAHGYATGGAPHVYPGADELLKHPATNANVVADATGHGGHYYYQEREPARRGEYYRYH